MDFNHNNSQLANINQLRMYSTKDKVSCFLMEHIKYTYVQSSSCQTTSQLNILIEHPL